MNKERLKQSIRGVQVALNELIMEFESDQSPQPEGYQGLNKWYFVSGLVFYANKLIGDSMYGYGITPEKWTNNGCFCHKIDEELRLATEEEIISAIKVGLKQHGIVEGQMVRCIFTGWERRMESKFKLENNNSCLYMINMKGEHICVFDNGEFAKVVEKETLCTCKSISEYMNCIKKCNRVKETTNRELLEECFYIIRLYKNNYSGQNTQEEDIMTEELLTKLNEHLKK